MVRDPFDTLLAEWNGRNTNSHTGIASIKAFSNEKKWSTYVKKQLKLWQDLYIYYIDHYPLDKLHILRYEKLKKNFGLELRHIMDFLGLKFDESVETCVTKKQTGSFKRPPPTIDFKKFFTRDQKQAIEKSRNLVYAKLGFVT